MLYGIVKYISTRGLGYEGEHELYIDGEDMFVVSLLNGNRIPVQWIEEGKSVEPKIIETDW